MNRLRQFAFALAVSIAAWWPACAALAANCVPSNITLFSATPAAFGAYSPYSPLAVTATFVVTIATNANCTNLYFGMTAASGTFAPTAPSLTYAILGNPPSPSNSDKVNVHNTTVTLAYTARIAAGQLASGGLHSSLSGTPIRLELYLKSSGNLIQPAARSIPLDASVLVLAGCSLPAPSVSNVDFTAALTTGIPNPAVVRTVTFSGASCIAPARIRLSGAALQPSAAMAQRPGFDTLIDWSAAASFGMASASLNTSGGSASTVTSASKNAGGIGPTSGNISVNINLQSNRRPQAGTYSGTLTVTIDPLF